MQNHRGAGGAAEFGEAAYVVDVRVGADDGADFQVVAREDFEDALDFVAGIDDQGFMRFGIAHDRAVALEHANGEDFVDQAFGHWVEYSIGVGGASLLPWAAGGSTPKLKDLHTESTEKRRRTQRKLGGGIEEHSEAPMETGCTSKRKGTGS